MTHNHGFESCFLAVLLRKPYLSAFGEVLIAEPFLVAQTRWTPAAVALRVTSVFEQTAIDIDTSEDDELPVF